MTKIFENVDPLQDLIPDKIKIFNTEAKILPKV